jgi:hypothetical protein
MPNQINSPSVTICSDDSLLKSSGLRIRNDRKNRATDVSMATERPSRAPVFSDAGFDSVRANLYSGGNHRRSRLTSESASVNASQEQRAGSPLKNYL